MGRLFIINTEPFFHQLKTTSSPYINRFLQPDSIIPDLSNPQGWNRYSYVGNNPPRFTDPTGHMMTEGCGDEGKDKCHASDLEIALNAQKEKKLQQDVDDRKCKTGNKLHCTYAENHPWETAAFVGGGLLLAGIAGASITYMSAAEAAATLNAGINVASDCVITIAKGGQCTAKNAAITASFSLVTGGIRGRVTSLFTLETAESIAGAVVANGVIQIGSNTLQRTVKGEATQGKHVLSDWGSGLTTTAIQFAPGDIYALSHLAEAVAGVFDAIGAFNPESGPTLIPGRDE